MAKLYNISTGRNEPVNDDKVNTLIRSGDYDFVAGEDVPVMRSCHHVGQGSKKRYLR